MKTLTSHEHCWKTPHWWHHTWVWTPWPRDSRRWWLCGTSPAQQCPRIGVPSDISYFLSSVTYSFYSIFMSNIFPSIYSSLIIFPSVSCGRQGILLHIPDGFISSNMYKSFFIITNVKKVSIQKVTSISMTLHLIWHLKYTKLTRYEF